MIHRYDLLHWSYELCSDCVNTQQDKWDMGTRSSRVLQYSTIYIPEQAASSKKKNKKNRSVCLCVNTIVL